MARATCAPIVAQQLAVADNYITKCHATTLQAISLKVLLCGTFSFNNYFIMLNLLSV
jgi:hypothetical protein